MFQITWWTIPSFLATGIALIAYVKVKPQDHISGGHALRFLFLALFIWSGAKTVASLMTREPAILLATQFSYLGAALTPVAWFVFAITYSQRVHKVSSHVLNTISIVPAVTLLLALSNISHGLIWSSWSLESSNGVAYLQTEPGFWLYVHAIYSYSLILVATAILAFALARHKQHYQAFLAAIFAPTVAIMASVFSLSPLNPYPGLDITPIGFVFGIVILNVGILKQGLLNSLPVAREWVVEQLNDPVLVITHDGTIIDANISALAAWKTKAPLLSGNINQLNSTAPLIDMFRNARGNSEVTIDDRAYDIAWTSLDRSNPHTDVAIVFRDMTERREQHQELQKAKHELELLAHTDALTHMYNRRFFMERLAEECERVKRHGSTLSVLVFDLDHFKLVNDTFGHDQGDKVLVALADVVNHVKRVTDVACRMGGEEFALLLPETDRAGAISLAQRLRRGIEEYPYRTNNSKTLKVTASIGVATVTSKTTVPATILKIADRALYRAKDGGRNMVCVDNEAA